MTVHHHPNDELILDYAAGGLGQAEALAVATHMTLCPRCRTLGRRLDAVGGSLLCDAGTEIAGDQTFSAVMAHVSRMGIGTHADALQPARAVLPAPLRAALGCDLESVPWKRLGMGAYHYVIPTSGSRATARLLRIPADRPVPVHTHRGTELTLVLRGAFSDVTGVYGPGDFQEADDALVHQPHAAPGEDCICLAVTEAPLRFRSWAARLVQPLLGI